LYQPIRICMDIGHTARHARSASTALSTTDPASIRLKRNAKRPDSSFSVSRMLLTSRTKRMQLVCATVSSRAAGGGRIPPLPKGDHSNRSRGHHWLVNLPAKPAALSKTLAPIDPALPFRSARDDGVDRFGIQGALDHPSLSDPSPGYPSLGDPLWLSPDRPPTAP
jgi:hypothetical protein